jgi:TRAP-type C4-dicarboxylate transport system substrate-binding protein
MVNWYKNNGFNAVGLTENDIVTQLKNPNGMINATPMPAYPASVLGVFRDAKFMLDIRVAPFTGAIIVTNAAWNKISAGDRTKLIESAKVFEKRMDTESPVLDASSVKEMRARGLTVTALDGKASAEFQAAADKLMASSKGTMVPNEIFDQAVQARDAFRKTKK